MTTQKSDEKNQGDIYVFVNGNRAKNLKGKGEVEKSEI